MSANVRLPRPVMILAGAAAMMSIGMGMRQSLGLFLPPVTHDLALKAADFTFAVAVQNIAWGLSQAPVGAIADKWGLRPGDACRRDNLYSGHAGDAHGRRLGDARLVRGAGRHGAVVHRVLPRDDGRRPSGGAGTAKPDTGDSRRLFVAGNIADRTFVAVPAGTLGLACRRRVLYPAGCRDAARRLHGRRRRPPARTGRNTRDDARRAGCSIPQPALPGHDLRLFRLWTATGFPDHALAELPGDLRSGSDAQRDGARDHRRGKHLRFLVRRLAWRTLS